MVYWAPAELYVHPAILGLAAVYGSRRSGVQLPMDQFGKLQGPLIVVLLPPALNASVRIQPSPGTAAGSPTASLNALSSVCEQRCAVSEPPQAERQSSFAAATPVHAWPAESVAWKAPFVGAVEPQ